ncbi:MAG: response regulator transcription factor [Pseudomonadota bacterium]
MRILLVEDDSDLASYVLNGLGEAGHVVDHIAIGTDAFAMAMDGNYDVAIIDRMLPGLDGLTLVKSLRAASVRTPILFLTAVSGVSDRVEGLESGGDDYLTKPFAFSELMARVNALGRRAPVQTVEPVLTAKDVRLDLVSRTVTRGGQDIDLLPKEFTLLEVLMRNKGRIVTRTMLLEQVWNFTFDPKTSVVETHISRLRRKIDRTDDASLIRTIRGLGYRVDAD